MALISIFVFSSCVVVPSGTPAQQAEQTRANASVANGAGLILLGTALTAWTISHHNRYYYDPCYGGGYPYVYPRCYNRYYYIQPSRHYCR